MKKHEGLTGLIISLCIVFALAAVFGATRSNVNKPAASGKSFLFTQTAESGSYVKASGGLSIAFSGVSTVTTRFTDRPQRVADTMSTALFYAGWDSAFKASPPNAAVVFSHGNSRGDDTAVLELSRPAYDAQARTLTFSARDTDAGAGSWRDTALTEFPASFGPASIFIDAGDDQVDASAAKQFYGLCFGLDPRASASYQPIPNAFMDQYLATIAPYCSWITDYRVSWKGTEDAATYAAKQAHAHGLKLAATAWLYWDPNNLARSKSDNEAEVHELISLINQGYVDAAVLGNEPEAQRGSPPYPIDSMTQDLLGYINEVKVGAHPPPGVKVPVGTRIIGGVGADAWIHTIASNCDFVQVTIHPANWSNKNNTIHNIEAAVAFLDQSYKNSRAQLQAWGLGRVELQVGETGWPTSADSGFNQALFTPTNAAAYASRVAAWSAQNGAKVFWFEAIDEPWKGGFDAKAYDSNWGVWHWYAANPANPFPPGPVKGRWVKKY
ncbi:MAG TPA: glycosyl hydrolase family 17 protein [Candidatus Anoxymicrobiaceae bacterium]